MTELLLSSILLVSGLSVVTSTSVSAADCQPSYRRLGPESAEVGHLTVETSWVLIGCRAELTEMSPAAVNQARSILAKAVAENPWGVIVFEKDAARRQELVKRLNDSLARGYIGDLLLVHANVEE